MKTKNNNIIDKRKKQQDLVNKRNNINIMDDITLPFKETISMKQSIKYLCNDNRTPTTARKLYKQKQSNIYTNDLLQTKNKTLQLIDQFKSISQSNLNQYFEQQVSLLRNYVQKVVSSMQQKKEQIKDNLKKEAKKVQDINQKKIKKYQQTISSLTSQNKKLHDQMNKLKDQLIQSEKCCKLIQKNRQQTQRQLNQRIKDLLQVKECYQSMILDLQKTNNQLNYEIKYHKSTQNKLSDELNILIEQNARLTQKLTQINKSLQQMQTTFLQKQKHLIDSYAQRKQQYDHLNVVLGEQIQLLQKKNKQQTEKNTKLKLQFKDYKEKVQQEKRFENILSQSIIKSLEKKIVKLKKYLRTFDQNTMQCTNKNIQIHQLKYQLEQKQGAIQQLLLLRQKCTCKALDDDTLE